MAKFIVIDGLDGCGKASQTKLLKENLDKLGYDAHIISFPNYSSPSSAAVKMYLQGEIGTNAEDLNPYMCGSFYAVDRFISYHKEYRSLFEKDDNTVILADRYLSSNIIHQGGKLINIEDRRNYAKWCYEYECELCGMPKEDLTILLTVPPSISQKLITSRYNGDNSKKDIHEANVEYLEDCYNRLVDSVDCINNNVKDVTWEHLDCYDESSENGIKTIDEIQKTILERVLNILKN